MTVDLAQQVAGFLTSELPDSIGVAVSGGSDSVALLHLLNDIATAQGFSIHVATVNHGLRAEAAEEADMVGTICQELSISHDILHWRGSGFKGNLQNEARKARYHLLSEWGRARGLGAIALGHTADDQAETFVMRLARRSGVDGLAAMPERFDRHGMRWIRPLLHVGRHELRAFLAARGIVWVDDPSNADDRFERVRVRKALLVLEGLGIDSSALLEVSQNLSAAKDALNHQMLAAAGEMVTLHAGAVAIRENLLISQPPEIRRRLIAHALKWVNGAVYPPRSSALHEVFVALQSAGVATVQGCELRRKGENLWIFRELQAVRGLEEPMGHLWDNRWRVTPIAQTVPQSDAVVIRALGAEGLASCPAWRTTGLPRRVLLSSPSVWQDSSLIAAPLAGWPQNWQAELNRGTNTFFAAHITH